MDREILDEFEDTPKKGADEGEEVPSHGMIDESDMESVSEEMGLEGEREDDYDGPEGEPDYDPDENLAQLENYAEEAARYNARSRWDQITAELQKLPNRPLGEEQLARLSESQRVLYQRALNKRDQLIYERDRLLPEQYKRAKQDNVAQAREIIRNQERVRQQYPKVWHKVIDRVRDWNDTGSITAEHLAGWHTFEMAAKMVIAEDYMNKQGRQNLRGMARQSGLAGRGGAAPDRSERQSEGRRNPRETEEIMSRIFDGDRNMTRRVMKRHYGG